MKRVSIRTLILLVELFAFVLAYQFLARPPVVGAAVVWLDQGSDQPADPNMPDEPEPQPE